MIIVKKVEKIKKQLIIKNIIKIILIKIVIISKLIPLNCKHIYIKINIDINITRNFNLINIKNTKNCLTN